MESFIPYDGYEINYFDITFDNLNGRKDVGLDRLTLSRGA